MSDKELARIMEVINEIRNARADAEATREEIAELERKREKIEDQIEGREDDLDADEKAIQSLEEELLELTRQEGDAINDFPYSN